VGAQGGATESLKALDKGLVQRMHEGLLYLGQEAIAVGACRALNRDDFITSTHRGHGHLIAKGGDFKRMFAELYGRPPGACLGRSGSLHIADRGTRAPSTSR
jgi:TPP-dependent pyruvate/acetoin dehydrogenase alpha subunit